MLEYIFHVQNLTSLSSRDAPGLEVRRVGYVRYLVEQRFSVQIRRYEIQWGFNHSKCFSISHKGAQEVRDNQ